MKLTVLTSIVLSLCATLFVSTTSFSQISIESTKGYSVIVNIQPEEIITTSKNCQWGYNYNIRFSYAVTVTGKNKPKSFYTLQGSLSNKSVSHFFSLPTREGNGKETTRSNVWRSISDCATATVTSMDIFNSEYPD